jgi:hypothetical protein
MARITEEEAGLPHTMWMLRRLAGDERAVASLLSIPHAQHRDKILRILEIECFQQNVNWDYAANGVSKLKL